MNLEKFLEDIGQRPKRIRKYHWDHKRQEQRMTTVDNNELQLYVRRASDKTIIMNNLKRELVYSNEVGPVVIFAIKIKGHYAFFHLDRITNTMQRERFQEFIELDMKLNHLHRIQKLGDNKVLEAMRLAQQLGGN